MDPYSDKAEVWQRALKTEHQCRNAKQMTSPNFNLFSVNKDVDNKMIDDRISYTPKYTPNNELQLQ